MEILLLTALLVLSAGGVEIKPVHPGEDVTLTGPDCSSNDSVRLKRKDSDKYIDSCIDGHVLRPDRQDPWFVGRVERMKCPMDGNVSVTLKNVTIEDAGEYEWFCNISSKAFSSTFYLNVTEPGPDVGAIIGGIVVFLGVITVLGHLKKIIRYFRDKKSSVDSVISTQQSPVTYREVQQQQV